MTFRKWIAVMYHNSRLPVDAIEWIGNQAPEVFQYYPIFSSYDPDDFLTDNMGIVKWRLLFINAQDAAYFKLKWC